MKIYHICDYCQQIYKTAEVEGQEGAIEITGTCEDCILEIGMGPGGSLTAGTHWYH